MAVHFTDVARPFSRPLKNLVFRRRAYCSAVSWKNAGLHGVQDILAVFDLLVFVVFAVLYFLVFVAIFSMNFSTKWVCRASYSFIPFSSLKLIRRL